MFNIYDICWYKCNFKNVLSTVLPKFKSNVCNRTLNLYDITDRKYFERKYDKINSFEITFDNSVYNDIISDTYNSCLKSNHRHNFVFFYTDTTLWSWSPYDGHGLKWLALSVIIAYIFSQKSTNALTNITHLGVIYKNNIDTLDIQDITDKVLYNVCRDYIGYNVPKEISNWRNAKGTNRNILLSIRDYYREILPEDFVSFERDNPQNSVSLVSNDNTCYLLDSKIKNELKEYQIEESTFSSAWSTQQSIYYISDLHLGHYFKIYENSINNNIKRTLWNYCNVLLQDYDYRSPIFLGGDVFEDFDICKLFYHMFHMVITYNYWKKHTNNIHIKALTEKQAIEKYEEKLTYYSKKYEQAQYRLGSMVRYFNYIEDVRYLGYFNAENSIEEKYHPLIKAYKSLIKYENEYEDLLNNKADYIKSYQKGYTYKAFHAKIFVVLGNHELANFDTVNEGISEYKKFFEKENIIFLHNSYKEYRDYCVVGGVGFAAYNNEFNTSNIIGPKKMSREEEIIESEKFYSCYCEALKYSLSKQKPLIVLTHYPTQDWLPQNKCDSFCYYINGHTHKNIVVLDKYVIFADNQVGYYAKDYSLKKKDIGIVLNPFADFEDGCYIISIMQYLQFMRYSNIAVSGTYYIDNALSKETTKFYMIKICGYYGFFIVEPKKEVKICYGGKCIKISDSKDYKIEYFYKHFITMVLKQLEGFGTYYKSLRLIQRIVQNMGLAGRIHGSIIDLNYYNHIMLNPYDNSLSFYYSETVGNVLIFGSFIELLNGSLINSVSQEHYDYIMTEYKKYDTNSIINYKSKTTSSDFVKVSLNEGMYAVSNRMNRIQKLFEHNVLSVWNNSILKEQLVDDSQYRIEEK